MDPPQAPPLPRQQPQSLVARLTPADLNVDSAETGSFLQQYQNFISKSLKQSQDAPSTRIPISDIRAPANFFFHDTLMHRAIIASWLDVPPESLQPRPGTIVGFSLRKVGKEKVLVAADPPAGTVIRGIAFEIYSHEHIERLWRRAEEAMGISIHFGACKIHLGSNDSESSTNDSDPLDKDSEDDTTNLEGSWSSVDGYALLYDGPLEELKKPTMYDQVMWKGQMESALRDEEPGPGSGYNLRRKPAAVMDS